jgi:hypothetical protein
MAEASSLANRIDAQFTVAQEKVKKDQADHVEAQKRRAKRLERLNKVFDQLGEI